MRARFARILLVVSRAACLLLLLASCPRTAAAQDDCAERAASATVDDAVRAYEEADFETANALFDQLVLGADLTRADLVRVYATRALLRFGDSDAEGMLHDLTALASLEPDYELGPRAPPPVHAAFDAARGAPALALDVTIEATPLGAHVLAHASGDRADIVRAVVVAARTGDGRFRESTDGTVTLTQAGDVVEYYARIVGPGGATLASLGSREAPQMQRLAPFEAHDDTLAIVLGTSGAALAVAALVVTLVLVLAPSGTNEVVGPTFQIPSM